jgi:hypothetical protein
LHIYANIERKNGRKRKRREDLDLSQIIGFMNDEEAEKYSITNLDSVGCWRVGY